MIQDERKKLFVDYVMCGGDTDQLVLRYTQRLEEGTKTEIKWGFRPRKWLEDRHGASKAKKLVERKLAQGLWLGTSDHIYVQTF